MGQVALRSGSRPVATPTVGYGVLVPNRLATATSPYLFQHADDAVDWRGWGAEAFAEARERDVPVLVFVGCAACHWCHVFVE